MPRQDILLEAKSAKKDEFYTQLTDIEKELRYYRKHFKDNGKDFLQLLKYAREHGHTYDDIVSAAEVVTSRGAKRLSSDLLRVALETGRAHDPGFREDQKTDEFLEIEIGSEDILAQLDRAMENGTTLENK